MRKERRKIVKRGNIQNEVDVCGEWQIGNGNWGINWKKIKEKKKINIINENEKFFFYFYEVLIVNIVNHMPKIDVCVYWFIWEGNKSSYWALFIFNSLNIIRNKV